MKIGITGGIGSGKSYVARIFKALGVPFYDADLEAKLLMNTDSLVRKGLIDTFGAAVYDSKGQLDRPYLADIVFADKAKLKLLNEIVHPRVIQHAADWADRQVGPYSLKEAALLFESGSYKQLDKTILVTAPEELRIERVMKRDGIIREQVLQRMEKQLPDAEKRKLADYILINDGREPLLPQLLALDKQFRNER